MNRNYCWKKIKNGLNNKKLLSIGFLAVLTIACFFLIRWLSVPKEEDIRAGIINEEDANAGTIKEEDINVEAVKEEDINIGAAKEEDINVEAIKGDAVKEEDTNAGAIKLEAINVGDIIEFGGYEWRVLEKQHDKALIISEYILESRMYHIKSDVTWDDSDLRRYLNGSFYNSFSSRDKAQIVETQIENTDNPWYGSYGGGNTTDKIFLLSVEEVVKYFGDSGQLWNGEPNSNVINRIDDEYNTNRIAVTKRGTASWWWLRSPGNYENYIASSLWPISIYDDGQISIEGIRAPNREGGVRPALYIKEDIDMEEMKEEDIHVGDIIKFGGYEWRVLEKQGDRALIISEYLLEYRAYHNDWTDSTWEDSDLRYYLNNDFYNYFNENEKAKIAETKIVNADNPYYDGYGGEDSIDKIFLLSIDEVVKYFGDSGQFKGENPDEAYITDEYDTNRIAANEGGTASWWWLRTTGNNQREAVVISINGVVEFYGNFKPAAGGGVRPALWLEW